MILFMALVVVLVFLFLFFFFNDTATTEIYTLSLHALFRSDVPGVGGEPRVDGGVDQLVGGGDPGAPALAQVIEGVLVHLARSEEHTSELQSRLHLVCRLLLEKKKKLTHNYTAHTQYNPIVI